MADTRVAGVAITEAARPNETILSDRMDEMVASEEGETNQETSSISNAAAVTSVALGACLIEKHVTLDRTAGGPDDSFSLEPKELAALCQDSKVAWQALGRVNYHITAAEQQNSQFRRSLYVVKDIKEGELFTSDNVKSIRPGFGLAPKHYFSVLGKKASTVIKAGTALTHSLLDL